MLSLCKGRGHDVVEAANDRIALDLQREKPAELIITDMFMPEKEGTEFIMDMRDEFPQVKIIAMSGGSNIPGVDFLALAINPGAVKTFQKPFLQQELLAAVEEILVSSTKNLIETLLLNSGYFLFEEAA